jgi:hypothetical protein
MWTQRGILIEAHERGVAKVKRSAETLVIKARDDHDQGRLSKRSFPLLLAITLPLVLLILVLVLVLYRIATLTPAQPPLAVQSAAVATQPLPAREVHTANAIPDPVFEQTAQTVQTAHAPQAEAASTLAVVPQRSTQLIPVVKVMPKASAVPSQPPTSVPSGPATTFLPNGKPIRE